jgi:RNA polymerase sigma factor (sigma-70 family)
MTDYLETEEFLLAFLNKDKKAFDALFEGYFERLYVFSFNIIGNEPEAEDIAIKSLTQLFALYERFHGLNHIIAFLYISVRNRSIDYLRLAKRQSTMRQEEFRRLVDEDIDLENVRIHGEQMKALYAAIEQLPEECRKVVELIYFEGLKYQEVADRLGISINSVKTQRRIGLIKLQAVLTDKNLITLLVLPMATFATTY